MQKVQNSQLRMQLPNYIASVSNVHKHASTHIAVLYPCKPEYKTLSTNIRTISYIILDMNNST